MKFSKTRQVKSPQRGTSLSAGIDFFVPHFSKKFIEDLKKKNSNLYHLIKTDQSYVIENRIVLMPQDRILIPSGVHVNFTEEANELRKILGPTVGLSLNANNKSGVASKLGLAFLASVCDEDYEGEIHISLVNTSKHPVTIEEGQKIIQFLLQPVFYSPIEEIPFESLYTDSNSERGEGGFGSTDKK